MNGKTYIKIDHCVLQGVKDGRKEGVEKAGIASVSRNSITFDDFVVNCNTVEEGTFIMLKWLRNVVDTAEENHWP